MPKKAKSAKSAKERDPEKEALYRLLAAVLERAGFQVRREELKRGPSWSVHSGSCRMLEQRLLFVDRRLAQDDQIALLSSSLTRLALLVPFVDAARLAPKIRRKIEAMIAAPVIEGAPIDADAAGAAGGAECEGTPKHEEAVAAA